MMQRKAKRSRSSESTLESKSGGRKRFKQSRSPKVIYEVASDSETPASSQTEAMSLPASSSEASSSAAPSRPASHEAANQSESPTSSNDEEGSSSTSSTSSSNHIRPDFRRISKVLDLQTINRRSLPPQLKTAKWGSPQKFWNVLCNKTKVYKRSSDWIYFHPDLTRDMRFVLLEWLMEVADDLSLGRESFYLAVDYIDRFFTVHQDIRKSNFQLVGATALFLAAKNEEVEPPRLSSLVDYGDGAFDEESLRECELLILRELEWQMNPVTPLHWLRIYMQLMGVGELNIDNMHHGDRATVGAQRSDQESVIETPSFPRMEFLHLAKVLDLCILDYDSLAYDYGVLPAAIFSHMFGPDELTEEITGYKLVELSAARQFVKPYLIVCERHKPVGQPIKIRRGIHNEEMHNIQTLHPKLSDLMEEAKKIRRDVSNGGLGNGVHAVRKKLRLEEE